jgi:hypothetical protein
MGERAAVTDEWLHKALYTERWAKCEGKDGPVVGEYQPVSGIPGSSWRRHRRVGTGCPKLNILTFGSDFVA